MALTRDQQDAYDLLKEEVPELLRGHKRLVELDELLAQAQENVATIEQAIIEEQEKFDRGDPTELLNQREL